MVPLRVVPLTVLFLISPLISPINSKEVDISVGHQIYEGVKGHLVIMIEEVKQYLKLISRVQTCALSQIYSAFNNLRIYTLPNNIHKLESLMIHSLSKNGTDGSLGSCL